MDAMSGSSFSHDGDHEEGSSVTVKRKRRKIAPGDASSMVCVVCGSPAFGYNFDVISCESCKAFFRRNAHKSANRLSQCVRDGACAVNLNSRKHCPSCRMKKCLDAGMRKELITPIEKLVNRANYRGKRSEKKSKDSASDTNAFSDDVSRSAVNSVSYSDEAYAAPSQPACGFSDEGGTTVPNSLTSSDLKQSPSSSDGYGAPPSDHENQQELSNIPDKLANVPPSILKSVPPEFLAKAKSIFGCQRSSSPDGSDVAHQCAKILYGQGKPKPKAEADSPTHEAGSFMRAIKGSPSDTRIEDQILLANVPPSILKSVPPEFLAKAKSIFGCQRSSSPDGSDVAHQCAKILYGQGKPKPKAEADSPTHEAGSFMRAIKGSPSDTRIEDQILKFMNPVDAIKMMPPLAPLRSRTSLLREEIFLEYFNNVKSGLMNIAKPLKKDEIMKTHLSEMPTNLEGSFNHMENMIRRVIAVLKCLPQFVALTRELQIAILKRSIHGLFAFCGALAYDASLNAFRVIYEEETGEINTFFLDFQTYVTQGLKDIRSTAWESFSNMLYHDKADELIKVNKVAFSQITSYTMNDRILIISLLCARFFNQSLEQCDVDMNEGMQWLLQRTYSELLLFIREYTARKSPDVDTEEQYQLIVTLFDVIKPLERAGEMLSHVVRLDGLNPLMREFLSFSKLANMNGTNTSSSA